MISRVFIHCLFKCFHSINIMIVLETFEYDINSNNSIDTENKVNFWLHFYINHVDILLERWRKINLFFQFIVWYLFVMFDSV
jgi:hypothetical protein